MPAKILDLGMASSMRVAELLREVAEIDSPLQVATVEHGGQPIFAVAVIYGQNTQAALDALEQTLTEEN